MKIDTYETTEDGQKRYIPDKHLSKWIVERVELEKRRQKFKEKRLGKERDEKLEKEFQKSRTEKTRLLDNVIFPSMTNLIYFFEALADNPTLKEIFEEGEVLQELLDVRSPEDIKFPIKSTLGVNFFNNPKNNLARMISAAVLLSDKIPDKGSRKIISKRKYCVCERENTSRYRHHR